MSHADRSKGPWIVGGIAAVLVVLLGVGWTLYAVGVFDPGTSGGATGKSSKAEADGEGEKPPDYSLDMSFEEACEALDLSEFTDILPEQDWPRTSSSPGTSTAAEGFDCSTSFTDGSDEDGSCKQCVEVATEGSAFGDDDATAARQWYDTLAEGLGVDDPHADVYEGKVEAYQGDWQEGVFACADYTEIESGAEKTTGICRGIVIDGNLFIDVEVRADTPEMPEQMEPAAMKAMLDDAVASVTELFTAA